MFASSLDILLYLAGFKKSSIASFWPFLTPSGGFFWIRKHSCFGYIAISRFFETFLGGWVASWVVGKFYFNENPVVQLGLGLRLRVCQHYMQYLR